MRSRVNYSGLVIAGTGFFLTRFTVTLAIYEEPLRFYLAGVIPLVLGLGLAAFGVALTVADVDRALVRTTARWCVVGTGSMLVLVMLTLLGSTPGGIADMETVRSQAYLSNFLIGGSIGGTLTGLYAARNRRQRKELHQQASRLEVLNRFLRHEILNSLTAIRGHATFGDAPGSRAQTVIETHSDTIEETIREVKYLTQSTGTNNTPVGPTSIQDTIDRSIATIRERYPDATVSVESIPQTPVLANERLERVFTHLLENAVIHTPDEEATVQVSSTETGRDVRVSISDDGPGLPRDERALLENGSGHDRTNPGTGFGLNVVRFLVESFGGVIETAVDSGTTITVALPRAREDWTGIQPSDSGLTGVRPALPHLLVTLAAALLAGVSYGVVSEQLGGAVSGIGVFYGIQNPVVGWITHEFHSIVFAFVFAGILSFVPTVYRDHIPTYVGIGLAWGLIVWFVAAGFVATIWLRLLGIPVPIPTFSERLLASHIAWGLSLGLLTALGYRYVTPRLADVWS